MAKLTLTSGTGGFTWRISGLSNPFSSANYKKAGITIYKFTQEAASISGIVDYVTATSSGTSTSVSHWVDYSPGTYTFWGFTQTAAGDAYYWPIQDSLDGVSVTVEDDTPSISSFTISAISGTLQGRCKWSIDNNKSGATYEIRASASRPSSYTSSGYSKGTYKYGTTSATISFDSSVNYYVWLNLFYDGDYIESSLERFQPDLQAPSTWSWTTAESNAFSSQGSISKLTRTRWNAFLEQVNLAIVYCNEAKGSSLTQVCDYEQMGTDKIMYASSFTQICKKINNLCSYLGVSGSSISSVSSGGKIYGYYFTNLSAALNRAINVLN